MKNKDCALLLCREASLSEHWLCLGAATELPQSSCHVKPKQAILRRDVFPPWSCWRCFGSGGRLLGFMRCFVILSDIRTVMLKRVCLRTDEKLKSLVSSKIPREGVKKVSGNSDLCYGFSHKAGHYQTPCVVLVCIANCCIVSAGQPHSKTKENHFYATQQWFNSSCEDMHGWCYAFSYPIGTCSLLQQ